MNQLKIDSIISQIKELTDNEMKKDIQWNNFTTDLIIDDLGELTSIISNLSKNNKVSC